MKNFTTPCNSILQRFLFTPESKTRGRRWMTHWKPFDITCRLLSETALAMNNPVKRVTQTLPVFGCEVLRYTTSSLQVHYLSQRLTLKFFTLLLTSPEPYFKHITTHICLNTWWEGHFGKPTVDYTLEWLLQYNTSNDTKNVPLNHLDLELLNSLIQGRIGERR